jgi:hypothetical protein
LSIVPKNQSMTNSSIHTVTTTTTSITSSPSNNHGEVSICKNVNLYWAATTALAIWFLGVHTPPFWKQRHLLHIGDITLATHIVTASTVYLVCAHNCLVTPSIHRTAHVWMGRFGLWSGGISFTLGAYLAWSRLTLDENNRVQGSTTLGFAIPITVGGILQIYCEVVGYRAIRQYQKLRQDFIKHPTIPNEQRTALQNQLHTALKTHISCMLGLFVLACSIPAGIRLAISMAGTDDGLLPVLLIVLMVGVLQKIATRYGEILCPPDPRPSDLHTAPRFRASYQSISH